MKASTCFLFCLVLQAVFSRPIFERDIHSVADEDGFYRHRSVKRSEGQFSLQFSAKLAPGIVSLDKDQAVEEIKCLGNELLIKTTESRNWNIGNILVGGPEWGCIRTDGEPAVIALRISKIRSYEGKYRVSGSQVPTEDLFAHFDLSLERIDQEEEEMKLVARQATPAFTFPGFAQTIIPGKPTTVAFAVDATKITADTNVTVRWLLKNGANTNPIIASVKAGAGSFTWTAADQANPVFPSTFQLTAGANVVESPNFWIQKQLTVTSFNANADGTSKIEEISLLNLTCATTPFCNIAGNCASCKIPNRTSFFKWVCRNCTANFNAVVNKFTIQTAAGAVNNFTLNTTVDFKNDIEYQIQSNYEFVGDLKKRVLTNVNLLTIPTFTVGGVAVNLAMFLDLDLTANVQSSQAMINGSLVTTSSAKYNVVYDNNAPVTVSATPVFGRPHSPIFANAPMITRFGITPTFRVSIQNNARALAASVDQYYIMDYRFGNPLPATDNVPFPDAVYTFGRGVCQQTHFQATAMSTGIDTNGEINLGAKANITNKSTPGHHAAGCNFAENIQDHINLVLQQAAIDQLNGSSVAIELRREIALVLTLPDQAVFISSEDKTNIKVVFIALQQKWGKQLANEYSNPNSQVYNQLLLKGATFSIDQDSSSILLVPSLLMTLLVLFF
eukprot:TRINITY_DN694_c0_g1_i1.p1 TRINITY_DN694_c0_g1~~TRINITY_DN694_c0_g1_i1.p1  ORF type:complete len:672 (+),score=204.47 TRINITY_DN694_c0_g1_i1:58-2073(+)